MWRDLTKILREVRRTLSDGTQGCGSYRPDLHYMRGPGPKWHAKYGHLPPKAPSASAGAALPSMAERRA